MLIVDDQLNCIKNLISSILKNEEKIRLIDVATNGIEALNILNKNKIDIILLDLKMPKMNGVELIKKLEKQQNNIYEKSIIIITGEVSMLKEILRSPLVYSFHLKTTSQENLLKNLNDIITEKIVIKNEENLDKKIIAELKYLNYNFAHIGTEYLKECIKIDFLQYNGEAENLNTQIYPILAKKHNKKIFSIKNNIIKATNYMYNECQIEKLMQYFRFETDYKPTPKTIIKTIINKL